MVETIFALSSGRPPAAVSVIRISGPSAHSAASSLAGTLPKPRTAGIRQLRKPGSLELLDEALVLRFDGPASATGEDIVEIQCHGGRAVVDAILAALAAIEGLRTAEPGEFTRRAFQNGRIDLTEAEGLADLIEAETELQRRAAMSLAEGGLRRQVAEWQDRLLWLSAQAERAIDYDDDDEGLDPSLIQECSSLADELSQWLARPRIERLKDGIRIVVAGPPNSGKSSLINAIVGYERSIVSDVPGTTRDHIDVPLSLSGLPVVLTDTAGLRETADLVEAIGVERAGKLLEAADIVLWLGEPSQSPVHPFVIHIHSKADLPDRASAPLTSVPVSAATGMGLAELLSQLADVVRSSMPVEDAMTVNRRQHDLLAEAQNALRSVTEVTDVVIAAEGLRAARSAFDRLTGHAGVEDVLDALFARFCLGK